MKKGLIQLMELSDSLNEAIGEIKREPIEGEVSFSKNRTVISYKTKEKCLKLDWKRIYICDNDSNKFEYSKEI